MPRPAPIMMQVVELADAADAGQRHLRVHGGREREIAVRVEPVRDLVHPLAPRPERASGRLGDATQRPVERVRVGVG